MPNLKYSCKKYFLVAGGYSYLKYIHIIEAKL